MKLADVKSDIGPIDPFKCTYTKKFVKDDVTAKVQTQNHWRSNTEVRQSEFQKGFTKALKWSEKDALYRCRDNDRLFDKIVKNAETYEKNIEEVEKQRTIMIKNKEYQSPLKGANVNL